MAIRYLSGVNIDTNTFFVDSTNNKVGIGTGTPSAKLDIDGAHVASIGLLRLNSSAANMSAMTYYIDGVYKAATYAGTDDNFYVWGRDADIVFNTTTSGTTRMVITNGGNVGIGTTGPTQKLMVGGSIRVTGGYYDSSNSIGSNGQVLASTGTGTAWINVSGGTVNGSGTVNYLSKWTGTTLLGDSLIYDNGTNIGIGTTAPGQKVDVVGAAATDTYLRVLGGAGTTKGGIIVGNNDSGKNYGSLFFDNANNNVYLYQQYSSGDLVLGTNTNEKMRITSGGNVGIGNTSPSQKLHVEGNIRVTGAYYDSANGAGSSGQVLSSTGSGTSWITPFSGSGTTNYVAKWTSGTAIGNSQIFDNGTNVGVGTAAPNNKLSVIGNIEIQSGGSKIGFNVNDAFSAYGTSVAHYGISYGLTANPLALSGYFGVGVFTSGTERMRIDGSGNVGIGTTSPSRLLHVAGNAQVDGWIYQGGYYNGSVTLPYPGANYGNGRIYLRLCSSASGRIMTAKVRISSTWNWAPAFGSVEADISFYWNGSSLVYSYVNILSATGQAATNLTFGALEVEGGSISVPVYSTNSNPIYAYIQLSPDADPSQVSYSTWSSVAFPGQANVYIQTNLGVGTPSPAYRLDVNGTFHAGGDATFNGTNTYINSSYIYVGNNTADLVSISGNTVYLPGDGNVGIGNTAPTQKLHVTGNVRVTGAYYDSSNAAGTSGQILSSTGTGTAWISPGGGGGIITGSGTTNYVTKWTSGTAVGDSSIFDNGNVGIGTTSPTAKLTIGVNTSVQSTNGIALGVGETSLEFVHATFQNGFGSKLYSVDSGGGITSLRIATRPNSTSWSDAVTIIAGTSGNGNVGIGTTSPNAKLVVVGDGNGTAKIGGPGVSGNYTGFSLNGTLDISSYNLLSSPTDSHLYINRPAGNDIYFRLANNNQAVIKASGNVGVGTADPIASLDNQGDAGTYRQRGFTTMVTNTLAAAGTQAKRYEIARASIDYNDWNSVGPIEVELYEKYYSRGLKKKYVIYYGYVSSSGCNLVEMTGSGDNQFMVSIGPEVVISGDNRYIPIYVDVRFYSQVTAVLKTNRGLTTSNPPGIADIWTNSMPTGVDISDFTPDSTVYVGNIIGGNSTFATGNVGVGTITPDNKLTVKGPNALVDVQSDADGQTVGLLARYLNNNALGAGFRYTTGDAQLYIDNFYPGNNGVYSDITIRNCDTGGTLQTRIKIKGSSGNIGIGETSPTQKLHVSGNIRVTGAYYDSANSAGTSGQILSSTGTGTAWIAAPSGGGVSGSGTTNYITKWTSGSAVGNSVMYDNGTNVGIGTTSPTSLLQVQGTPPATSGSMINVRDSDANGSNTSFSGIFFNSSPGTDYSIGKLSSGPNGLFQIRNGNTGAGYITINNSGNVGIGTTAPNAKLVSSKDVSSNDFNNLGAVQLKVTGSTNYNKQLLIGFETENNYGLIQTLEDGASWSSYNLAIQPKGGNVGIGTTSPNKQLTFAQVNDDAIQIRRLTTSQGNTSLGTGISWTWTSSGTDNETWAAIRVIMPGNGNTNMTFSTTPVGGGGSGLTERMRISDNGNVGIGTTSPNAKLNVLGTEGSGSVSPQEDLVHVGGNELGGVGGYAGIRIGGASNTSYGAYIRGVKTTAYGNYWNTALTFSVTATNTETTVNEVMRITSSGNVGIGTTSPNNALTINRDTGAGNISSMPGVVFRNKNTTNSIFVHSGIFADTYRDVADPHYSGGIWFTRVPLASNLTSGSDIIFGTGGYVSSGAFPDERMRITWDGAVGIGATAPTTTLDVRRNVPASSGTFPVVRVGNSSGDWGNYSMIEASNVPDGRAVRFGAYLGASAYSQGGFAVVTGDNGDIGTNPSIKLFVRHDGNVGIGTTAPQVKTHIYTATDISLEYDESQYGLWVSQTSTSKSLILGYSNTFNAGIINAVHSGVAWRNILIATNGGNVGIGTTSPAYKLDVSGTIRATGDVIAYSDARVKENVETLDGALDKVMKMRGVSYNKIGEQEKKVGVIAQEILEVLPEVVSQDETGTYSVAYGNIVSVLIEAIKEQQKQIDELKSKLK